MTARLESGVTIGAWPLTAVFATAEPPLPQNPWVAAGLLLAAYVIGSIPFGLLIGRLHGIDIREHGSGNIGATNVLRVLGPRAGGAAFALDLVKGLIPTAAGGWALTRFGGLPPLVEQVAWLGLAAAAMLGHMFPPWLGFRGGKGVATGFGALLGIYPVLTSASIGALAVWCVSAALTRRVGISSCIAALAMPVLAAAAPRALRAAGIRVEGPTWLFLGVICVLAAVVVWKHRANLARTWAGTEPRIGERRPPSPSGSVSRTRPAGAG